MCGLLRALGVEVYEVEDYERGWLYVADVNTLFLDANLSQDAIDAAVDRLLPEVFHLSTS